jgi:GMP synthase-like glutamine amidotransferase
MPAYRLGFLLCDHALEHLREQFGDYPAIFATAFASVSPAIEWVVYDATAGQLPASVHECDGFLISGSRHGAYDGLPWIKALEICIRQLVDADRPVVGLCFGHQMLGQALGGEVRQAAKGWGIGLREYDICAASPWMSPQMDRLVLPVCHQDQVLSLPPGARTLAGSAHCPNFMVQFGPRAVGIQGHPEFSPAFVGALIEWRQDRLPAAVRATAQASLTREHDSEIVKRWIATFLELPQEACV